MPLKPSRFALWCRLTLSLLAGAVFLGPTIAAFATSRPAVAVAMKPPIAVIQVHPFLDLSYGSCIANLPMHIGPTHRTEVLFYEESLRERMNQAAEECARPSSGYLVLSVSVDKTARITDVTADAGADEDLAGCATTFMRRSRGLETRGPGTLQIGYFMGHERP